MSEKKAIGYLEMIAQKVAEKDEKIAQQGGDAFDHGEEVEAKSEEVGAASENQASAVPATDDMEAKIRAEVEARVRKIMEEKAKAEEPTKAITIRMPLSLFKKFNDLKYARRETLNTLGIAAIELFVQKTEEALNGREGRS